MKRCVIIQDMHTIVLEGGHNSCFIALDVMKMRVEYKSIQESGSGGKKNHSFWAYERWVACVLIGDWFGLEVCNVCKHVRSRQRLKV